MCFGVNKVNVWWYAFWQFSSKLVGGKKYLIVSDQKSFGERFDHLNCSENILESYCHLQKEMFKIEISELKIFSLNVCNFYRICRCQQIITAGCSRYYRCYFTSNKWLLISKNSYLKELIRILNFENVQFYKKWHFHHVSKWVHGWVLCKNSYLKVIPMNFLGHVEHFEYLW